MPQLAEGLTIAGYRIDGFVGRGGMGEVYRATELASGRLAALKLVAPGAGDGFEERFRRESALAASLEHPNIAQVYETGVDGGRAYIAMRFVEGTDLGALLQHGPLELDAALAVLAQVAAALDAAHDRGLAHRDVKPGNILLERCVGEGRAFLADFGLAKELAVDDGVTGTGTLLGTPDYMAPEQVHSGIADARSDVYSLGCVFFEMLTGRVPFPRDSEVARMWAHVNEEPPSLAEVAPDLPAGLDAVVAKAMAKEPEDRYGAAGELARAAVLAAAGSLPEGIRSLEAPEPGRAPTPCPYMGLQAFQPEDAAFFFGREDMVAELVERLGRARFLAVVGASGSGKSSLVRAGLIPALERPFTLITPGEHPLETLDQAAPEAVLVVDQFEEAFTLCRDELERGAFVEGLLARPEAVVIVLRADFYGRCAEYPALAAALEGSQALVGPMKEEELRRAIVRPAQRLGLHLENRLLETVLHDVVGEPGALPLLSHALLETWKRRIGRTLTLGGYLEAGGVEGALAQTAQDVYEQRLDPGQQALARSILLRLSALGEGTEDTRRRVRVSELVLREGDEPAVGAVLDTLADARLITRDEETVEVAHEALIRHWPTLQAWLDEDREGRRTHRQLTDACQEWEVLGREQSALYRGARLAAAAEWADGHAEELNELERAFLQASREAEQSELDQVRRRNRRLRYLVAGLAVFLIGAAIAAVLAVQQTREARGQQRIATSRALAGQALALLGSRVDQALLVALEAYRSEPTFEARNALITAVQRTGGMEAILGGEQASVNAIAVGPDGRTIAAGDGTGTVLLWDAETRRPVGEPVQFGGTGGVLGLAIDPTGTLLAASMGDGSLWLVGLTGAAQPRQVGGFVGGAQLAFADNGARLVGAGAFEGVVRFWDVSTGRQEGEDVLLDVPGTGGLVLAENGEMIAVFGPEGVALVRAATGETVSSLDAEVAEQRPGAPMPGIALSPDAELVATVDEAGAVTVWGAATGEVQSEIVRGGSDPFALSLNADGSRLAVGREDGIVELFETKTGAPLGPPFQGHAGFVARLAFARDGSRLASVGRDGLVILWSPGGGSALERVIVSDPNAYDIAVSPDGSLIAVTTNDGRIELLDPQTGEQVGELPGQAGETVASFSPDGRTLAAVSVDGLLRFWNVPERRLEGEPLKGPSENDGYVVFSPNGERVATWSVEDGTVKLWDAVDRRLLRTLPGRADNPPWTVAFSPDSQRLAVAFQEGSIKLFDLDDMEETPTILRGHSDAVNDVAYSPDGQKLASVSVDGTLRFWRASDGSQDGEPLSSGAVPVWVKFSPDGRTLQTFDFTSVGDVGVTVWDVARRVALGADLRLITTSPSDLEFLPNGSASIVQSGPLVVRLDALLWSSDVDRLAERVCDLAGRSLSLAEWELLVPGREYRQECASAPAAPAAPVTPPIPTVEEAPAAETQAAGSTMKLPAEPGPLEPGSYQTNIFQVPLAFELPDGWAQLTPEQRRSVVLELPQGPTQEESLFVTISLPVRPLTPDPEPELAAPPDDWAAWFESHPRLRIDRRQSVDVGGVPGVVLDSTITKPYENPGCPAPCVVLFSTGAFNAFAVHSQRTRNYIVEVGGQTLLIGILAPKSRFDELVGEAEAIVRSIRFD